jgi:competence protein ComEC
MLFQTGLQLSFLAVAGIAFLYPRVYKWFFINNKYLDKVWKLVAVSIAAQTATFPLSIYCFHQFPNYFIPANLVIIPLSTIGIFSGILLLFLSPFPFLSVHAGWLVSQLITLLNASAVFMENLPGSVWYGISIHFHDMIVIYLLLFVWIYFMEKKSIKYFYAAQFISCLLLCSFIFNQFQNNQKKTLLIFSNTRYLSCQFRKGDNSWLFYHSVDSAKAFSNSINYCLKEGLPESKKITVCLDHNENQKSVENTFIHGNCILFGNFVLLDMTKGWNTHVSSNLFKPDLICISGKNYSEKIFEKLCPKEIIVNDLASTNKNKHGELQTTGKIYFLRKGARLINL